MHRTIANWLLSRRGQIMCIINDLLVLAVLEIVLIGIDAEYDERQHNHHEIRPFAETTAT